MPQAFDDLQQQLFALYPQKRYAEALELVREGLHVHPSRASRIGYWIACLECMLGKPDQGLATMSELVAQGHWFSPRRLAHDEDLAPLRGRPEFAELIEACEQRRLAEQAKVRPELLSEPPTTGVEHLPPLVVALHMMGGDARESLFHWRPATSMAALLAAPQGGELIGPGEYGWSERTEVEIRRHLENLGTRHTPTTPGEWCWAERHKAPDWLSCWHFLGNPWLLAALSPWSEPRRLRS
ncbi:MAG: hypothetical protein WD273_08600 [Trueperaceae bacterium]